METTDIMAETEICTCGYHYLECHCDRPDAICGLCGAEHREDLIGFSGCPSCRK